MMKVVDDLVCSLTLWDFTGFVVATSPRISWISFQK